MAQTPSTQAPQAPKGQQYGQQGAQLAAQKVVPVAGSPQPGAGRPRSSPATQRTPTPGLEPGNVPTLEDDSVRPGEPLTSGLRTGPGAGPEALGASSFGPEELSVLRLVMGQFPNDDLRRLIEWTEQKQGLAAQNAPLPQAPL